MKEGIIKWYSFSESTDYSGPEPPFFNIEKKTWKKLLEENTAIIKEELEAIVSAKDQNIIPYFNQTLASSVKNWTIFPLYIWGKKNNDNCNKCIRTVNIIEQIPGLTSCSFSILKPHTFIKPHRGDSNVMYRCHLTLKCNGTLNDIGMRVQDQKTGWQEGKLFAFCDAYEHEVWNNTYEEGWVLIIDILREEFLSQKKQICAEVNSTLYWQLKFQHSKFLNHLPGFARRLLMKATSRLMQFNKSLRGCRALL